MENSPFVLQKEKGAYVQQDMARLCRKYAPRVKPSVFPRLGVLPLRIALLGFDQPWIGAFCRKVMELNFVGDQDINQPEQMAPVVAELGLSALGLMDRAQSEPIKTSLREQTEQACAKGIFGRRPFSSGRRCSGAMIASTMLFCLQRNRRCDGEPRGGLAALVCGVR
jgi:2-hydroxychromene-2-carboxylate isomerase